MKVFDFINSSILLHIVHRVHQELVAHLVSKALEEDLDPRDLLEPLALEVLL